MGFRVRYSALFHLFLLIDGFEWVWPSSIMTFLINDPPHNVFCNISLYAGDTTSYSKCDQASNLWQLLELASELEYDSQNTPNWVGKCIVDFSAGKTQLVSFDWSV